MPVSGKYGITLKNAKPVVLIVGALVIASIGLTLQLTVGLDAFARSGSLIVAYGVALAGREIFLTEKSISERESRVDRLEAAYLDAIDHGEKGEKPAEFSRLANNLREFRASRLERMAMLINTEIGIVCFGTIIWGFGDLVGK